MAAIIFGVLGLCSTALANEQVGQTVLLGSTIPKFVEQVPTFNGRRANGAQFGQILTLTAEEFQQQILPASFYDALPSSVIYRDPVTGRIVARINPRRGTYVWGYKVNDGNRTLGPSYPGPTILAQRGIPTKVKLVNNLLPFPGLPGPLLQKFLTVDLSFHWANPLNLSMSIPGTDPSTGLDLGNPAFYGGPQPMTVHLHGAEVPSAFDGGPDTWFTPGKTIKGPGFVSDLYTYPNNQEATTLWYHDHVLGETRLNVYSGLAAFYLLRGDPEADVFPPLPSGDEEVELVIQDKQFDSNGQLFFPDGNPPGAGLNGDPGNPTLHAYAIPEFFGDVIVVNGKSWPYMNVEPRRYRFHFLNGSNARMYALQLADKKGNTSAPKVPTIWQIGSDGGLFDKPVKIDAFTPFTFDPTGGFLGFPGPRLFFAPAERMDVIIDFSGFQGQTFTLVNDANHPFPGGDPSDPTLDGLIMQFRVNKKLSSADLSFNPAAHGATLRNRDKIVRLADGKAGLATGVKVDNSRRLVLIEQEDPDTGAPVKVVINNTHYDGNTPMGSFSWQNGQPIAESIPYNNGNINVTEIPQIGSTEVWEFINLTPDAHPIHIHLIQFQVLSRQVFNVGDVVPPIVTPGTYRFDAWEAAFGSGGARYGDGPPLDYLSTTPMGGNPDVTPYLLGSPLPPDPNEAGWKDTLKMYPGTVTRLVTRWAPQDVEVGHVRGGQNRFDFDPTAPLGIKNDGFGFPGGPGYMVHCHILDHEDNDMMRPFELSFSPQR
ncbi:MAG: multicopper oxidase domain-containing protein [Acidobacteriia bacterium]|nr:multicopper oxidase domain-containing protein [Terriglobia bacterium]